MDKAKIFIDVNKKRMNRITPSQWGQVRSLAMRAESKQELINLLFEDEKGFLVHGKAEELWRKHHTVLQKAINGLDLNDNGVLQFIINISSEMAKMDRR